MSIDFSIDLIGDKSILKIKGPPQAASRPLQKIDTSILKSSSYGDLLSIDFSIDLIGDKSILKMEGR